tara:strand:+ start:1099 stop:2109 length:1011 start_codon:yes stop_codon:yes gene_type:complete
MANYFKFYNHEYENCFLNQPMQFRFGRLKYYRLLEILSGCDMIGDLYEGISISKVGELSSTSNTRNAREIIRNLRITYPDDLDRLPNIKWNFSNIKVISVVDCYIFSLAHGDFETAATTFGRCGPNAYDRASEFSDISLLVKAIAGGTVDGQNVSSEFDICAASVKYTGGKIHDVMTNLNYETSDPFQKRPQYDGQMEYRIVLIPKFKDENERDHVDLKLSPLDVKSKQVSFAGCTRVINSVPENEADIAMLKLSEIYIRSDKKYRESPTDFSDAKKRYWQDNFYADLMSAYFKSRTKYPDKEFDEAILLHHDTCLWLTPRLYWYLNRYGFLNRAV